MSLSRSVSFLASLSIQYLVSSVYLGGSGRRTEMGCFIPVDRDTWTAFASHDHMTLLNCSDTESRIHSARLHPYTKTAEREGGKVVDQGGFDEEVSDG